MNIPAPSPKNATPAKPSKTLQAHPATRAMTARIAGCNLPPIQWNQEDDGTWTECYLQPDCTYGGCVAVDASAVPPELRK